MKRTILISLLHLVITVINAQTINEPYNYPVKPGMQEWKQLKSGEEMAAICNIPQNLLSKLSTQALVVTCLSYPLFNEVLSANNLQAGFSALLNNFNGFRELMNRKDAGTELLKAYQKMNVKALSANWSLEERGAFTFGYTYAELLLSQMQILSKLSDGDKQLLRKEAVKKFQEKKDLMNDFGLFGLSNSAWILGKLLQAEEKQNLVLKNVNMHDLDTFLSTGSFGSDQVIDAIFSISKSL